MPTTEDNGRGYTAAEWMALCDAAPDLLEACKALDDNPPRDSEWATCGCCDKRTGHHSDCALILARAAIAKATATP